MIEMKDREFITPFGPEKGQQARPEKAAEGIEDAELQAGAQAGHAEQAQAGAAAEMHSVMPGSASERSESGVIAETAGASTEMKKNKALTELDQYLRDRGGAGSVNVHDLEGTPPDEILNVIMSDK